MVELSLNLGDGRGRAPFRFDGFAACRDDRQRDGAPQGCHGVVTMCVGGGQGVAALFEDVADLVSVGRSMRSTTSVSCSHGTGSRATVDDLQNSTMRHQRSVSI
jgi:hypothetical protein